MYGAMTFSWACDNGIRSGDLAVWVKLKALSMLFAVSSLVVSDFRPKRHSISFIIDSKEYWV